MKTNPSTAYRWVVAAMDRITAEPAKQVLELELRRLDQLQTAIYADALQGDLSSQQMYLRIADQRARLLGLYPKGPQVNFNIAPEMDEPMRIEFVLPDEPSPPVDVPAQGEPDYSKPALPPPPERVQHRMGWIEEDRRPPRSGGPQDWLK